MMYDPDVRLSVQHDPRGRFAYIEHRIVDALHNFIIGTHVTATNIPGHRILLLSAHEDEHLTQILEEIAMNQDPILQKAINRKI